MKRATGIGGIVLTAKVPAAHFAGFEKHPGVEIRESGGAAFRWTDEKGSPLAGTTARHEPGGQRGGSEHGAVQGDPPGSGGLRHEVGPTMRRFLLAAALAATAASAQASGPPGELLERLAGKWVLEGTMAGKSVTHDVDASPVLNGGYVQLHEVSREKDAQGRPAYEAIVYLTWEPSRGEYSCLWLDSTSNAGITNGVTCRARPAGDELRLLFRYPAGNVFHTTFAYDRKADTWEWKMDDEEKGRRVPFARVTLRRKPVAGGSAHE